MELVYWKGREGRKKREREKKNIVCGREKRVEGGKKGERGRKIGLSEGREERERKEREVRQKR